MNSDSMLPVSLKILFNPIIALLFGGIIAVSTVRFLSQIITSHWPLLILLSVGSLVLGILLSRADLGLRWVGIALIGFGIFLLYSGIVQYELATKRHWLRNRRLHFEGELTPPDDFHISAINGTPMEGRLFLAHDVTQRIGSVPSSVKNLRLTGEIEWFSLSSTFREYLKEEGYLGVLQPLEIHSSSRTNSTNPLLSSVWLQEFRKWLMKSRAKAPYSTLFIQALTTGNRTFPNHVNLVLRRLGIIHLFVISGLHVGLLLMMLNKGFCFLPQGTRGLIIGLILIAYLSFLGWPVSALRAGVMVGLGGLAFYLGRRTTPADILCSVVLLLMVWDPYIIFDVGFQLSISALMGILLVLPDVDSIENLVGTQFLRVNIGAFFGTLPVLLWHFNYIAPLGIVGSYVAGFVFPFFVCLLALQTIFLAVEWTFLYRVLENSLVLGLDYLFAVFGETGLVWGTPSITIPALILISALILVAFKAEWNTSLRAISFLSLVGILYLLTWGGLDPHLGIRTLEGKPIVFLRTLDNKNLLFLPRGSRTNSFEMSALESYLNRKGVRHLDYLMSDYGRRLFSQFDPNFTVMRFVPYWLDGGRIEWSQGYFDVDQLLLKSTFLNLRLKATDWKESLTFQGRGLFARTGDGRCLINNSSALSSRQFQTLEKQECDLTFLREKPLVFDNSEVSSVDTKSRQEPLIEDLFSIFKKFFTR